MGGGIYRYGASGQYLGRRDKRSAWDGEGRYDADAQFLGYFEVEAGYDIVGFTQDSLYLQNQETDAFYRLEDSDLIPMELELVRAGSSGCSIRWTTLYGPNAQVWDHSPFYEVFHTQVLCAPVPGSHGARACAAADQKELTTEAPAKETTALAAQSVGVFMRTLFFPLPGQ